MNVTPDEWRKLFSARDIEVLTVTASQEDPNTLLVYLHGNSGQAATGEALRLIRSTTGVAGAVAAEHAPNIIRVWLV